MKKATFIKNNYVKQLLFCLCHTWEHVFIFSPMDLFLSRWWSYIHLRQDTNFSLCRPFLHGFIFVWLLNNLGIGSSAKL